MTIPLRLAPLRARLLSGRLLSGRLLSGRGPIAPQERHGSLRARRTSLLLFGLIAALALSMAATVALPAPTAAAVTVTGHAVGYQSADGYWIGSYRLADDSNGFCVNLGRSSPTGSNFTPVDAASLGWYTTDDTARLAYIARTWGATTDADTAAAAQLATWMITGLDGRTSEDLAARAGSRGPAVRARAEAMVAEVAGGSGAAGSGGASRGVSSRLSITRSPSGTDSLRAEIDVDFLAGVATLSAGTHRGLLFLDGAEFADGSAEKTIDNGRDYPIRPTGADAVNSISAQVAFDTLPYGIGASIAHNPGNVQNLLIATPAAATSASTAVTAERPSITPFQPIVQTRTSVQTGVAGSPVSDRLRVGVRAGEDLAVQWGVFGDDGGPYRPIPVIVRSTLFGPFPGPPEEADAAPEGAQRVCELTTLIDSGPGDYNSESCVLGSAGYYVWTETIDAVDTPASTGGARILPWHGRFGLADETTLVPAPVVPAPIVTAPAPVVPAPVMPAPIAESTDVPAQLLAATGAAEISPASVVIGGSALLALAAGALMLRSDRRRDLRAFRSARS